MSLMEAGLSLHESTAGRGTRDILPLLHVLRELQPTALAPEHVHRETTARLDSVLLFSKGFHKCQVLEFHERGTQVALDTFYS